MVELHRKAVKLSKQIESRQLEKALSESGSIHGFRKMVNVPIYRSDGDSDALSPEEDSPKEDYHNAVESQFEYTSERQNDSYYSKDSRRDFRGYPEFPSASYKRVRSYAS